MGKYDGWEETYRRYPPESLPWELGRPRPVLVELIESGLVEPAGEALDICCGLGTNTVYLAESGFITTGIDISPTAVARAEAKAAEAGVKIRFLAGDSRFLPFSDGEFAFVLDMGCFHHIRPEDRDTYLAGVRRVLATGGRYFVVAFSDRNGPAWNHLPAGDIVRLVSAYFEVIDLREFGSVEGDGATRYFHAVLMEKRAQAQEGGRQ